MAGPVGEVGRSCPRTSEGDCRTAGIAGPNKGVMTMRVDYRSVFPAAVTAMAGLEEAVHASSLDAELLELVKLRASQLNGCGYCVDMHTKDAKAIGVEDQRLHLAVVWKEAPVYSPRERAALAWCEALTILASSGVPDDVYEQVAGQFSSEEI